MEITKSLYFVQLEIQNSKLREVNLPSYKTKLGSILIYKSELKLKQSKFTSQPGNNLTLIKLTSDK